MAVRGIKRWALAMAGGVMVALAGCQASPKIESPGSSRGHVAPANAAAAEANRAVLNVPVAWGGEVRCMAQGCMLAAVEHERSRVVLHRIDGRNTRFLDAKKVAYHPDSAIWLADDLVAAAVEASVSIDVFRVVGEKLEPVAQIPVGFNPRDVILVKAEAGRYTMLVTPYSGAEVAWIMDWSPDMGRNADVRKVRWCEAAWHPVKVSQIPGMQGPGVAVACLDDKRVIAVSESNWLATPKVVAQLGAVARNARPSPSGKWLYVSLETGARNARIHMQTGELQWVASPLTGSVSVAPLADDLVVWGDDIRLYLQRLDATGAVLETRWYKASGFATSLQLIDVDRDGEQDVVVYNSSDNVIDVVYGPLWANAQAARP